METLDEDVRGDDREFFGVMRELFAREPIFHRPELGTERVDFDRMMAEELWEVGASGRQYDRDDILDALDRRHAQPHRDSWEIFEFRCQRLAPDLFLVAYTLRQGGARLTRRMTIWRKTERGWEIVYHQGTVVQDAAAG